MSLPRLALTRNREIDRESGKNLARMLGNGHRETFDP